MSENAIDRCPECRHAPHDGIGFCPNMASDNDCSCTHGATQRRKTHDLDEHVAEQREAGLRRAHCAINYAAEPDAGDVASEGVLAKTLRDAIWAAFDSSERLERCTRQDAAALAFAVEHILASRLAAVRREAGDERAEQIAQAIEAHTHDPRGRDTWTLRDAARIARAARMGGDS